MREWTTSSPNDRKERVLAKETEVRKNNSQEPGKKVERKKKALRPKSKGSLGTFDINE